MRSFFVQRFARRVRELWVLARTERTEPRQMALAAFTGLFIGASPAVGVRSWLALLVASLLKTNRLYAYLTSHVTANWFLAPWLALAEIQLAHRLRAGTWLPLDVQSVRVGGAGLLLDWCLGALLIGVVVGLVGAGVTYRLALGWQQRRTTAAPTATGEAPLAT